MLLKSSALSRIVRFLSTMTVCYIRVPPLTRPREDDTKWPQKNKDGRQELEIRLGSEHISFEVLA